MIQNHWCIVNKEGGIVSLSTKSEDAAWLKAVNKVWIGKDAMINAGTKCLYCRIEVISSASA